MCTNTQTKWLLVSQSALLRPRTNAWICILHLPSSSSSSPLSLSCSLSLTHTHTVPQSLQVHRTLKTDVNGLERERHRGGGGETGEESGEMMGGCLPRLDKALCTLRPRHSKDRQTHTRLSVLCYTSSTAGFITARQKCSLLQNYTFSSAIKIKTIIIIICILAWDPCSNDITHTILQYLIYQIIHTVASRQQQIKTRTYHYEVCSLMSSIKSCYFWCAHLLFSGTHTDWQQTTVLVTD